MENKDIAALISEMADLLEIKGENVFKIRAYQRAVQVIVGLPESLQRVHERGELATIAGIGKGLAEKIREALETGRIKEHEALKSSFPEGLPNLLKVSGVGPKKVKLFYETLGIGSIGQLKEAAEKGKLAALTGMGKKSEERILKGIANLEQATGRFTLGVAHPIAREISERIGKIAGVKQTEIAGSLRRCKETIGDVDILVTTKNPAPVMEEFLRTNGIQEILAHGGTKSSLLLSNGLQVDLRAVPEESFGAALQYFTGSKAHNVQLRELAMKKELKVNEYGVFDSYTNWQLVGKTEEEVYAILGLAWIPPELREGLDEIDLAEQNRLPRLIEMKDIRSALHNHTTESDGVMTLEELAAEAQRWEFKFIAVTDHSGSLGIANGLSPDRLRRQMDAIHEFNARQKTFRVLTGSEVEIKADGSLDYNDKILEQLDVVIASVHTAQEQPRAKLTERVRRAISNPHVNILGHPSGRLLGQRPAMDLDYELLFQTAAETGVIMEINAHYLRLDLNDQHIREAKKYGVKFTINTDAHKEKHFHNLIYGVQTARRGRLGPEDVINTLTLKALKKILQKH